MNKHIPYDLKQMQSLPLEAKIIMSQRRFREWYEYWDGAVYISFSGGKDSTVLCDLCARVCQMYGWKLYLLFVNTGLEYPEIQKFVKTFAEWLKDTYHIEVQLDIVRPKMRFDEVLKKYGYPVISKEVSNTVSGARKNIKEGRYSLRLRQLGVMPYEYGGLYDSGKHDYEKSVAKSKFTQDKWRFLIDEDFDSSEKCCYHIKKAPSKEYEKRTGRKPIIAIMASESMTREAAWLKKGCNAFDAPRPASQPMSFWTNQDVLHYIKKYDVPYCPVYGEIVTDIGGEDDLEGQINLFDYLGCHEPEDKLKTTGCDRTGCIFCMFGCHLEKEPNRFQRLKETHPRQYEYCINGGQYTDFRVLDSDGNEIKLKHCTREQIEKWVSANLDNENFTIKRKWQPNKEGLGLGHVLDRIGVNYK